MGVRLIQQTKAVVLPFGRIDRLGTCIVHNGFFVFAEEAVDFPRMMNETGSGSSSITLFKSSSARGGSPSFIQKKCRSK